MPIWPRWRVPGDARFAAPDFDMPVDTDFDLADV